MKGMAACRKASVGELRFTSSHSLRPSRTEPPGPVSRSPCVASCRTRRWAVVRGRPARSASSDSCRTVTPAGNAAMTRTTRSTTESPETELATTFFFH